MSINVKTTARTTDVSCQLDTGIISGKINVLILDQLQLCLKVQRDLVGY